MMGWYMFCAFADSVVSPTDVDALMTCAADH